MGAVALRTAAAPRLSRQPAPVLVAAAVIVAAWVALLAVGGHGFAGHGSAASSHHHGHHPMPSSGEESGGVPALPLWLLMTVAMMGPSALPALRHVACNSLRWRRGRASAQFAAVYLALWTGFGAAVLLVRPLWDDVEPGLALAVALALAAAWQLTAAKRRALGDCHRSSPLPPRGWPAVRGVARFGARNGGACVRSCWPLMLAMAVVPSAHLVWMAGLTALVTAEKLTLRPRRATRAAAGLLALAAAGAGLVAAAG